MDVKSLADKGDVFTSDKDKNILQSIDLLKLVQYDSKTITMEKTLEHATEIFSTTNQKIIPVLDEKNMLVGIIDYESVKPILFNPFRVKFTSIQEVLSTSKTFINFDDGLEKIMKIFENSKMETLPVLKNGKYLGLVTKLDILENYRSKLKEMMIE